MAAALPKDPKPAVDPVPNAALPAPAGKPSRAGFLRRLSIGANVTLQMVLLAFILVAVNGYAFKHYHRFDFSRDRKYALSDRTKGMLKSLAKPVKIIVFMEARSPLQGDVANLAEEYRVTNPKLVTIENIDPFRNVGRATEVQTKYKLAKEENVVILDCEGRSKIVPDNKMAELDTSMVQYGQPPTISAFTGEQAITGGLLEVIEGKKSNVYYVQGHGESVMGVSKPLETLGKLLDSEHVTVQEVNLLNAQAVPADTGVLMILGPRLDFTEREVGLLDAYWNKGGRVLLLLNPDAATPHLDEFAARLGIRRDDDRVLRTVDMGTVVGVVRDVYTTIVGNTPVAKQLAGINVPLLGATATFTLETDKGPTTGTQVQPLLQPLKGYWGEVDYKDTETTGVYLDQGKDKEGNLVVAATVEKNAVADQRVQQTNAARLVIVNNSRFVEKDGISEQSANFFVGSLNWLLERDALIGVAPKLVKTFTLSLPDEQIRTLFWVMVLAIPGACALLGLIVWWRRRS